MAQFVDTFQSQVIIITQQERDFLNKYGGWIERLEAGKITPFTERQVHFLAAIRRKCPAEYSYERLWLRIQAAVLKYKDDIRIVGHQEYAQLSWAHDEDTREIERLNKQVAALKRELSKHGSDKYGVDSAPSRLASETCHQCGGDGGAGGRCSRCGGNGFEP
jgi:uncharacterized protein YifE (UPF0438 family)